MRDAWDLRVGHPRSIHSHTFRTRCARAAPPRPAPPRALPRASPPTAPRASPRAWVPPVAPAAAAPPKWRMVTHHPTIHRTRGKNEAREFPHEYTASCLVTPP
eukprot:gene22356-biopygen17730